MIYFALTAAVAVASLLLVSCNDKIDVNREYDFALSCWHLPSEIVPGEQVVYNKKNNRFEVKIIDTKLYTSWKDGYYKFEQMTLEEIMETLSLWYDLNVFYVNAEVKSLEFTGRLRRYDRVEGLLRKFEQMNLVEFELNGRNVMIRKK